MESSIRISAYPVPVFTHATPHQINFFSGMFDTIKSEYKAEGLKLINERLKETHYNFINTTNLVRPQAKYFLKSLKGDFVSKIKLHSRKITRSIYRKLKK